MDISLAHCYLYPIKGCAAVSVDSLHFDVAGHLVGDRDWIVVNAQGRMSWLGEVPQLTLLRPQWHQGRLHIEDGSGDRVAVPAPEHCRTCEVEYWEPASAGFAPLEGFDAGDLIAELASLVVGTSIRLVNVPSRQHRPRALHIVCKASLCEMLQLPEGDEASIQGALMRFRPNLVLDTPRGQAIPFVEEHARHIRLRTPTGEMQLDIGEPCERCIAVNIDPITGLSSASYLNAVTRTTRQRAPVGGSRFGVYAHASEPGQLDRGATGRLVLDF